MSTFVPDRGTGPDACTLTTEHLELHLRRQLYSRGIEKHFAEKMGASGIKHPGTAGFVPRKSVPRAVVRFRCMRLRPAWLSPRRVIKSHVPLQSTATHFLLCFQP